MGESESKKRSVVHRLVFDRSRFGRRAKAVVRARARSLQRYDIHVICKVCSRDIRVVAKEKTRSLSRIQLESRRRIRARGEVACSRCFVFDSHRRVVIRLVKCNETCCITARVSRLDIVNA